MGVKSARPSFTAFRQLPPMNRELLLKIPTTVTNFGLNKDLKKHNDEFTYMLTKQKSNMIATTQGKTFGYKLLCILVARSLEESGEEPPTSPPLHITVA